MICEYCDVEGIETEATYERGTYERGTRGVGWPAFGVCDDCRAQFPPLGSEFDNELAGTEELRMPPS